MRSCNVQTVRDISVKSSDCRCRPKPRILFRNCAKNSPDKERTASTRKPPLLIHGCCNGADKFRPLTDLKILVRILTSNLQIVAEKLIGSEQTGTMKGWTVEDNMYLICTILDKVSDDTIVALVNLNQSKAYNRVDHQFLAAALYDADFCEVFCS